MTRYEEQRRRFWGSPVPPKLKHGRGTRACTVYGCPCKQCLPSGKRKRKAWRDETPLTGAERRRRSRENLRGKPVPEGTKHGTYVYNFYRCRCPTCVAAWRAAQHRWKNPWRYRSTRGRWREDNETTILCWPPATAGGDWECECERKVA